MNSNIIPTKNGRLEVQI